MFLISPGDPPMGAAEHTAVKSIRAGPFKCYFIAGSMACLYVTPCAILLDCNVLWSSEGEYSFTSVNDKRTRVAFRQVLPYFVTLRCRDMKRTICNVDVTLASQLSPGIPQTGKELNTGDPLHHLQSYQVVAHPWKQDVVVGSRGGRCLNISTMFDTQHTINFMALQPCGQPSLHFRFRLSCNQPNSTHQPADY